MRDPWIPILLLFTVLLTVWLGIAGPMPSGVTEWIKDWQNLIAAIIAVGAALLAYRTATRQLALNDSQERNRRSRKHKSLRAVLPLALSQISEYTQDSAFALLALIPLCQDNRLPHNSPINNLPKPLPDNPVRVLAGFVEYSDDIDVPLVEILATLIQIHDSSGTGPDQRQQ